MAKVLIDIPDEIWASIKHVEHKSYAELIILKATKEGIPLPKGYGRLIDADALEIKNLASSVSHTNIWGVAPLDIDIAPTIIEADKEGE